VTELLARLQTPLLGPVTLAELLGDATGIWCVWLVARAHILNWPIGLLNNLFFFLIFWWSRLYGDATLQLIFAALGVYGWWLWSRAKSRRDGGTPPKLPIVRTVPGQWWGLLPTTVFATILAAFWLAHCTDSPVPLWDATVLTVSLAATYLQAQKCLESWWLWIAVDVLSIPLYIVRNLYPTAALYFVFLLLCLYGYREWYREWKLNHTPLPAN
jgi:nicotinamide mononucleotide transporter